MFVLCLLSSVSFQAVASLLRYAPSACCVLSVCPSVLFPLLLLLPLVMFPFFLSLPFHFFLFLFLSSYALFLFSFLRYRPLCPPSSLALFSRPLLSPSSPLSLPHSCLLADLLLPIPWRTGELLRCPDRWVERDARGVPNEFFRPIFVLFRPVRPKNLINLRTCMRPV